MKKARKQVLAGAHRRVPVHISIHVHGSEKWTSHRTMIEDRGRMNDPIAFFDSFPSVFCANFSDHRDHFFRSFSNFFFRPTMIILRSQLFHKIFEKSTKNKKTENLLFFPKKSIKSWKKWENWKTQKSAKKWLLGGEKKGSKSSFRIFIFRCRWGVVD